MYVSISKQFEAIMCISVASPELRGWGSYRRCNHGLEAG